MPTLALDGSRIRITIFSPKSVGNVRDPEVDRLVAELQLHPAVLRHAPLGDVEPGDDLDAGRELVLDGERRLGDLAQLAVDAKAHAIVVFVGLKVQVGRAQVDRVDQHLLQEADDRRVFDVARRLGFDSCLVR